MKFLRIIEFLKKKKLHWIDKTPCIIIPSIAIFVIFVIPAMIVVVVVAAARLRASVSYWRQRSRYSRCRSIGICYIAPGGASVSPWVSRSCTWRADWCSCVGRPWESWWSPTPTTRFFALESSWIASRSSPACHHRDPPPVLEAEHPKEGLYGEIVYIVLFS